jgi:hypothetical protein
MLMRCSFHSQAVAAEVMVLLLLHPVHDGSALVDLPHLVGAAGVVEDALCGRRLTGINVGHDADVARLL